MSSPGYPPHRGPHAEDTGILHDYESLYSKGSRLILSPHKPVRPYGKWIYPQPECLKPSDMILSEAEQTFSLSRLVFEPANSPLMFDKNAKYGKEADMEVEILEMIGGRPGPHYTPGKQKLLCRVLVAPATSPNEHEQETPSQGQLLFLKVFDAFFWYKEIDITQSNLKVTILADSAFSDEYGAYHYLYECGRTGFPDLAPEFYGGWTAKVTSVHPAFENKTRKVAVLALEYVDGVCLQKLFLPPHAPALSTIELYKDSSAPASFSTDQEQRMKIVAQLMDGTLTQEFLGLDHCGLHPKNVIVTMRNLGQQLEEPRAVLVDYCQAWIDHMRTEPVKLWQHWPTKPHPLMRFGWHRLDPFRGWIPSEWRGPEHDIDDTPLLDQWMVKRFGPLTGNDEYTMFVTETLPTVTERHSSTTLPTEIEAAGHHLAPHDKGEVAEGLNDNVSQSQLLAGFSGGQESLPEPEDDEPIDLPENTAVDESAQPRQLQGVLNRSLLDRPANVMQRVIQLQTRRKNDT